MKVNSINDPTLIEAMVTIEQRVREANQPWTRQEAIEATVQVAHDLTPNGHRFLMEGRSKSDITLLATSIVQTKQRYQFTEPGVQRFIHNRALHMYRHQTTRPSDLQRVDRAA